MSNQKQDMSQEEIELARKRFMFNEAITKPQFIIAEKCRRRFYFFVQTFWHVVSSDTPHYNWHIEYLCDTLQKIGERVGQKKKKKHDLLINQPPGTTKTIICTIMFPVWCWTNWHWIKFLTLSYSQSLSIDHSEKSRDILRSNEFELFFPELAIKADKDLKQNYQIVKKIYDPKQKKHVNVLGGNRFTSSVGGTMTGQHGDILIVDDPLDPKRAASKQELKATNDWIQSTLTTRKTDKERSVQVLVMQRLAQQDPSGVLLEKKAKGIKKIKHICLPAEINESLRPVPEKLAEKYTDGLLDPKRLPREVLRDIEADLGQYQYAGQMGQTPIPISGGMFKVKNFNIIDTMPEPSKIVRTVRYWDKAGTKDGGCYTVSVKMSLLLNGMFLISSIIRQQLATEEREDLILATARGDGESVEIWIEQEPGSGGKDSAKQTVKMLAGYNVRVDRPSGDKAYRASPFSVQVNRGNVYLLQSPLIEEYMDELKFFPKSKYKDQVDASSGAFSALLSKKEAKVF